MSVERKKLRIEVMQCKIARRSIRLHLHSALGGNDMKFLQIITQNDTLKDAGNVINMAHGFELPNEGDALISAHIVQLEQTPPSSKCYGPSVRNLHYRECQVPQLGDAFRRK